MVESQPDLAQPLHIWQLKLILAYYHRANKVKDISPESGVRVFSQEFLAMLTNTLEEVLLKWQKGNTYLLNIRQC